MNPDGTAVHTSQVHVDRAGPPRSNLPGRDGRSIPVTGAGFVSGAHDVRCPSRAERAAAGSSLGLGLLLLSMLPAQLDGALYVAVLGGAAATAAIVGGAALWSRPGLVAWTVTAISAGAVLVLQVAEISVGLPGVGDVSGTGLLERGAVLLLAGVVLVLTVVGPLRRTPERLPEHPYAL